ncbi:hypothetical protein EXIGLDRAFT_838196 [Exidia glandulosa HHB12029]|uniref:F-box domain-containing protein n=1 Tax=Exidia glandulosa HHB12029 TaxID=1314781 RepID=A0A165G249_EXIGL|nr:hypothetical protein EXIGLDRAFT_838196 [Exidia glandulosa HHB12029]
MALVDSTRKQADKHRQMLLFRERQGLVSVVNLTLQCVLDRTTGDIDPEPILLEIADVVQDTLEEIRGRIPRTVLTPVSPVDVDVKVPISVPHAPSAAERVPNNVLAEILRYIAAHRPGKGSSLKSLVDASHVCHRWRAVALANSFLWTSVVLPSLGEMRAISTLLSRSGSQPLCVKVSLLAASPDLRDLVLSVLAEHMGHIKKLTLFHDSNFGPWPERQLLESRAPILEELVLESAQDIVLPLQLFGGQPPPKLRRLTVNAVGRLPYACPGLSNLQGLVILNPVDCFSVDQVKDFLRLCPRLGHLSVLNKLLGAPKGVAHADNELRGLRQLDLREGTGTTYILMPPTLRMFNFVDIPIIHMRNSSASTTAFIAKELSGLKYLFFLRSSGRQGLIILRDGRDCERIYSQLIDSGIDLQLKRVLSMASQLVDLALWEYITADDLSALFAGPMPVLRTLTIFVRDEDDILIQIPAQGLRIFEAAKRTRAELHCPALETLCFTSQAPLPEPDVISPATRCPALSATAIQAFVQGSIVYGKGGSRLPMLIMDSVRFAERFAGPEVESLRKNFSGIVMQ